MTYNTVVDDSLSFLCPFKKHLFHLVETVLKQLPFICIFWHICEDIKNYSISNELHLRIKDLTLNFEM